MTANGIPTIRAKNLLQFAETDTLFEVTGVSPVLQQSFGADWDGAHWDGVIRFEPNR